MFSKTFAERQKYFKETTAFSCICDFCQHGEEDENDIAFYEAFKVHFYHNYVLRIFQVSIYFCKDYGAMGIQKLRG